MNFVRNRYVLIALRWILGAIFIYAGITKVQQPLSFADSIATFRLLPNAWVNIFALALPTFEIVIGLMLLTGWKCRLAAFATVGLTAIFAVALGQALIRGLNVDCGCFGSGRPSVPKTWMSFGRDILLMAVSLWLYLAYSLQRGRVV